MARAEDTKRQSHAWVARGNDGIHFTPDSEAVKFYC